jgi:PKD repeat protein
MQSDCEVLTGHWTNWVDYWAVDFRTRRDRDRELTTAEHTYDRPGRYTVAVKVVDIFGNDTMTLVPVNVG